MKTFKWILIILIAIPVLLVAGLFIKIKLEGPAGAAEANTLKILQQRMKDPNSMAIRSSYTVIKAKDDDQTEYNVCGIVDGKNSFGGYSGGTRFASRSVTSKRLGTFDTSSVELEDEDQKGVATKLGRLSAFEAVYWNDYCVDSSHPALTPPKASLN